MLSRAQAASLLGSVRPNRTEPERPGWATEQAEPSMQATEPSPSGGSARFARFDYRPANRLSRTVDTGHRTGQWDSGQWTPDRTEDSGQWTVDTGQDCDRTLDRTTHIEHPRCTSHNGHKRITESRDVPGQSGPRSRPSGLGFL